MTDEQILNSINTDRLTLNSWGKLKHYLIVLFLFITPILFIYDFLKDLVNSSPKQMNLETFLFITVPSALGLFFYNLQSNRLKFKIVETNLKRSELDNIIDQVATELKWTIIKNDDQIVEAKTYPSLLSGSWGEQITILFDNKRVLVNSICDLERRSSVASMGRNRKNTNRIIEEIEKVSR